MKKLCIIGGMGPLATADFYNRIILKSPAKKDQEHIETLIISDVLMPDRTTSIISGKSEELLARFQKNFDLAESWGADILAIPCNTSHYYMEQFRKMTRIRIIDMVVEASKLAPAENYVLATEGTYKSGIYKKRIEETGKKYLELSDEEKEISNSTIYRIKKGEKPLLENFKEFRQLLTSKVDEGKGIILACTELSLLDIEEENVIDAMDALVNSLISEVYRLD